MFGGKNTIRKIGRRVTVCLVFVALFAAFTCAFLFGADSSADRGYAAVTTSAAHAATVIRDPEYALSNSSCSDIIPQDVASGSIVTYIGSGQLYLDSTTSGTYPYVVSSSSGYTTQNTSRSYGPVLCPFTTPESFSSFMSYNGDHDVLMMTGLPQDNGDMSDDGIIVTFPIDDTFKKILKDKMLSVYVQPYIVSVMNDTISGWLNNSANDGASMQLGFYNGTSATSLTDKYVTLKMSNEYIPGQQSGRLSSLQLGDNCFFQVRLHNFGIVGGTFAMSIREIGLCVKITPNNSLNIARTSSGDPSNNPADIGLTTTCIVEGTDRNASAPAKYAKYGDTLDINVVLRMDGKELAIDTAPYTSETPSLSNVKDGTMFRRLFLNPSDKFLLTWTITEGYVMDEEGDPTQDSDTISVDSGNCSGQRISFTVYGGDSETGKLIMVPTISYRNDKGALVAVSNTNKLDVDIIVDEYAPNVPEVDPDNLFYLGYLDPDTATYYTSVTELSEEDSNGEVLRFSITGATAATRPEFTAGSVDIFDETDMIVYYRTYYYGEERPQQTGEKKALGFAGPTFVNTATSGTPVYEAYENRLSTGGEYYKLYPISEKEEAKYNAGNPTTGLNLYVRNNVGKYVPTEDSVIVAGKEYYVPELYRYENTGEFSGIYLRVSKSGNELNTDYDNIFINLKCTDFVRDENGQIVKDGLGNNVTEEVLRKSGVWAIEFYSYDYAGHKTLSSMRLFVDIDITEYEFVVNYTVESGPAEGKINSDNLTISAAVYDADGKLGAYSEAAINSGGGGSGPVLYFRRGDHVMIKLFFRTSDTYLRYILTSFAAGNTSFATTQFRPVTNAEFTLPYYTYQTVMGQDRTYSFTIDASFCSNEALRQLTFAFKTRVNINYPTPDMIYDGTGKGITISSVTPAVAGSATVGAQVKKSVTVQYYTDSTCTELVSIGAQGQNQPIDVGIYYFKAELTSHNQFYGVATGLMRISPKTPVINPINPNISIGYGDSLATLDSEYYDEASGLFFVLRDEDGFQIAGSGINVVQEINNRDYFLSTMSLPDDKGTYIPGYYVIAEENKIGTSFTKPNAGKVTIRVRFIPVKGTITFDNNVPKTTYQYDENKNFIPDENYNVVYNTVTITVVHDDRVSFSLDASQENGAGNVRSTTMATNAGATRTVRYVEYTYNGRERTIGFSLKSAYETVAGGEYVDLYDFAVLNFAPASSLTLNEVQIANLRYAPALPKTAGIYAVRITLNESKCNYTTTIYTYIHVKKIGLSVRVDTREPYVYQYENLPDVDVTKDGVSYLQEIAGFSYAYYYYDGSLTYDELIADENRVAESDLRPFSNNPVPAGDYFLVVTVTDDNYEGVGSGVYSIRKVATGNDRLAGTWPMVNGSALNAQYDLFAGQPLSEVNVGLAYSFTYTYRVYRSATSVTGSLRALTGTPFIACLTYDEWLESKGLTDDTVENRAAFIAEMKAFVPTYAVDSYAWYLCFAVQTTDAGSGEVTFDMNFDFLYRQEAIAIGKAYVDWESVSTYPVTYYGTVDWAETVAGAYDTYGEALTAMQTEWSENRKRLIGADRKLGYLYSLSGNHAGLGEGDYYVNENNYVFRYVEKEYVYGVAAAQPVVASAGEARVNLIARFDDNDYDDSYEGTVTLVVEKREIEVVFGEKLESAYRCYRETDAYAVLAYYDENNWDVPERTEVDSAISATFRGTFAYYRVGNGWTTEGTYTYDELTETPVAFADLTVGTYFVTFTLNHANYDNDPCVATVEGTDGCFLTIVPSVLTATVEPTVEERYVTYAANVAESTLFRGGTFMGEGGEGVRGTVVLSATYGVIESDGRIVRHDVAGAAFPNAGATVELTYVFVPEDDANYESYVSLEHARAVSGVAWYGVRVTVRKADISESLTLSTKESSYEYKTLLDTDVADELIFNYAESIAYTVRLTDAKGNPVPLITGYALNAGMYTVTVTLEDDDYAGSVTCPLTIDKKKAYIPLETLATQTSACEWIVREGVLGEKKEYNGGMQGFEYSVAEKGAVGYEFIEETATVTYYTNGIARSSAPGEIGLYEVRVHLKNSVNYVLADAETDDEIEEIVSFLMISVRLGDLEIINLEQTFNVPAIVTVFMGGNDVDDDAYEIHYRSGLDEYTDLPVAAGTYDVLLVFDPYRLNGYDEVVLGTDIDPSYKLVISRYYTEITVPNEVVVTYTGVPGEKFYPYTSPYEMSLAYAYKEKGGDAYLPTDLASLGALDAGEYDVKITITDNNYRGEKVISLIMNKARLTMKTAPTFGEYEYNSDVPPAYLGEGSYTFGGVEQAGTFSVATTKIRTYGVGTYSVSYSFTPDSDNFFTATGTTKIRIVKRVLPDDFLFFGDDGEIYLEDGDYSVEFNETVRTMTLRYDYTNLYNYPEDNADFSVSVKYARAENPSSYTFSPSEIGTYIVTAQVSSKNYTLVKTWDYRFIITQGTPVLRGEPTFGMEYPLGYTLRSSDLIGGIAEVQGTHTEVPGKFSIQETVLSSANEVPVTVTFTPSDTGNFRSMQFTMLVNVIGKDPIRIDGVEMPTGTTAGWMDWGEAVLSPDFTAKTRTGAGATDGRGIKILTSAPEVHGIRPRIASKTGEVLEYGATVSDLTLILDLNHQDCAACRAARDQLTDNGTFSFAYSDDQVLQVGAEVPLQYRVRVELVEDAEQYNNLFGYISTTGILVRKRLTSENATFSAIRLGDDYMFYAYAGEKPLIGIDTSDLSVVYGEIASTDGASGIVSSFVEAGEDFVTVNITTNNYEIIDLTIPYTRYTRISENSIVVGKTSKTYDGKPISVADLDVNVHGTEFPVKPSMIDVIAYDLNSNVSDGIGVGIYSIVLTVRDDEHYVYGTKNIYLYTVRVRDVSQELELMKPYRVEDGATVYYDTYNSGSHVLIEPELNGHTLASGTYRILIKKSGQSDYSYTSVSSLFAGEYIVKVDVYADDMAGSATFNYTVDPQHVYLTGGASTYTVTYGGTDWVSFTVTPAFVDEDETFFSLDDRGGYSVYYYSETYSKKTDKPANAGEYLVSVEANNPNYRVYDGVSAFVVLPKPVRVESAPTPVAMDMEGNHLIYGQPASVLTLYTASAVVVDTQKGTDVAGRFVVADSDKDRIFSAGERSILVEFRPDDVNYAVVTVPVTVTVGQKTLKLVFENLSAAYTGSSRKNELRYKDTGEDVTIAFTFTNATGQIVDPVTAGTYTFRATVRDPNYRVDLSNAYTGDAPTFTVRRASVDRVTKPTPSVIGVGESLNKASLSGGQVYYVGFDAPIKGSFGFVESGRAFGAAGEKTVEVVFTPDDNLNFASYRTTVRITVGRGRATVTPGVNTTVYGTPAVLDASVLQFTTLPADLNASIVCDFACEGVTYRSGDIMPAGTYWFTCRIDDDNYLSEDVLFSYVVEKKTIDIDFIDDSGSVVTAYSSRYGTEVNVDVRLYDANNNSGKKYYLLKDEEHMRDLIEYRYVSRGETAAYDGFNPPKDIGSYDLTVTLRHDDYVATETVIYRITTGKVESIDFETDTLIRQEYGTVSAPIIVTSPANVKYYVIYQGYERTVPTAVGSYNMTVYIDDENYESDQKSAVFRVNPKPISVNNIRVQDKVYDGVATLTVTAGLEGVFYGDEVFLNIGARTYNGATNVGEHFVEITQCTISGLNAENYTLAEPKYDGKVRIYNNTVSATTGTSYIISEKGFESGTGLTVREVETERNKTSVWSKMVGVESTVLEYVIKVDDVSKIVDGQYKICVEIPEQYRDGKFNVDFAGELSGYPISYTQEGKYLTFYASTTSGEVVFSTAQFKYGYVVTAAVLAIILIAIVVFLILNPMHHRRSVTDPQATKEAVRRIKREKRGR